MEAYRLIARVEGFTLSRRRARQCRAHQNGPAGPALCGAEDRVGSDRHGLKDSESAMSGGDENPGAGGAIDADVESVRRVLGV